MHTLANSFWQTTCRNNISIRYQADNGRMRPNINGRKGIDYRIRDYEINIILNHGLIISLILRRRKFLSFYECIGKVENIL